MICAPERCLKNVLWTGVPREAAQRRTSVVFPAGTYRWHRVFGFPREEAVAGFYERRRTFSGPWAGARARVGGHAGLLQTSLQHRLAPHAHRPLKLISDQRLIWPIKHDNQRNTPV